MSPFGFGFGFDPQAGFPQAPPIPYVPLPNAGPQEGGMLSMLGMPKLPGTSPEMQRLVGKEFGDLVSGKSTFGDAASNVMGGVEGEAGGKADKLKQFGAYLSSLFGL